MWTAPIERCNGVDDDGDGVIDEDCGASLWAGVFPPGGGADLGSTKETQAIESATARPVSVIQTYHGTSAAGVAAIGPDLAAIWAHGAVPHLNVEPSGYTQAQYAAPVGDATIDHDLGAVAAAIAAGLSADPKHRLLLTFGAEMNGNWTDWGCLSANTYIGFYKKAHDKVATALAAAAPPIDPRRVRWVYGPNSTSSSGCATAAAYYPGHGYVDYLGMSAYRSGTATVADSVVTPAKDLLTSLGYSASWSRDRFIVLQTGSRVVSGDDRGAWLTGLYSALAADPAFLGVIYFDSADWAVASAATPAGPHTGFPAWTSAMASLPVASSQLDGTFEPFFWDVGVSHARYAEVQSLRAAGLTAGCSASPPAFCPDDPLTRSAAAVLLAKAFGVAPDTGSPPLFTDVAATDSAFGAIQGLAKAGVITGCTASTFCPTASIDRQALALALAKLSNPPPGSSGVFSDLPSGDAATTAIEALAGLQRVDACATGQFCPNDPATRSTGAAWIVRSANVPPAPHL